MASWVGFSTQVVSLATWKIILLNFGSLPKSSLSTNRGTIVMAQDLVVRPYSESLRAPMVILLEE